MEFHAPNPAHPMGLIQPLVAGAAQVSAALPAPVQSALVTRENASFLSKPARPGLIQGCGASRMFVQAHTSLTRCCGAGREARTPETAPKLCPRCGEKDFTVPRVPGGRENVLGIAPLREAGWAINYTNAISRGHCKHRQEKSHSCS